MRQRKETQRRQALVEILFQLEVHHSDDFVEIAVQQHHALGVACGARGVENIGQVVHFAGVTDGLHLTLQVGDKAAVHEVFQINRLRVVAVQAHFRVVNDDFLQAAIVLKSFVGAVVLILLAHENNLDAGIFDDVFNLSRGRCRINGNAHCAKRIDSRFAVDTFGFIL